MPDSIQIRPNFRKFMILADSFASSSPVIRKLADDLADRKGSVELHEVEQFDSTDFSASENEIYTLLSSQKMGTFLYIAGLTQKVANLQRIALDAGFSDSEMEVIFLGEAEKQIFCAGCQDIFKVDPKLTQITCQNCGLLLTITDHYSPRLACYLGYQEIK